MKVANKYFNKNSILQYWFYVINIRIFCDKLAKVGVLISRKIVMQIL